MNTAFKIASGAALSAVALSVAALSVPTVKIQALKWLGEFPVVQALVQQVILDVRGLGGSRVSPDTALVALPDLKLAKVLETADDNGLGALDVAAGGTPGNPASVGTVPGTNAWGGIASLNGLTIASLASGGSGGKSNGSSQPAGTGQPAGADAPLSEASAPDAPVLLAKVADFAPLPGETGPGAADTPPAADLTKDAAALPLLPTNDFGMKPESDPMLTVAAAAPSLADISAIPEPGTLALLGVALVGFGALRRQRNPR